MLVHGSRRTWLPILLTAPLVIITVLIYASWNRIAWTSLLSSAHQRKDPFELSPSLHATRTPKTLRYEWRITAEARRPDGVLKPIYLINEQFPGPTIEARPGDRLVITVENALDEGLAIHWHGLHMQGANAMDGAAGITQDPIAAGETFIYDFVVQQQGTFWYHAHSSVQRADGLYGGLVFHEPLNSTTTFDPEYLLMIGDWYHRQAVDVLASYLTADSFGMEPVPDSILVNGRGHYNCSMAVPARPVDCHASDMKSLSLTNKSRLRIINVGAYAGISMRVVDSRMQVITVDGGNPVSSATSDSIGVLEPGERIDLILEAGHDTKYLDITLDSAQFKYSNLALSASHSFPLNVSGQIEVSDASENSIDHVDLQQLVAQESVGEVDLNSTLTLVLYTITEKLAHLDYVPHGNINRTIWKPQFPSLLSTGREQWDEHQFVPIIPYSKEDPVWVTLVVNNLDEESHSFHLHGHDFHVLSTYSSTYNWGSFNPYEEEEPPSGPFSTNPLLKDTISIPRGGYAILRFRADNPGLWMFHCHVIWHMASGMAMTFEVG